MRTENKTFNADMIMRAFPRKVSDDVATVARCIPQEVYTIPFGGNKFLCRYKLLDAEEILFPDRVYGVDDLEAPAFFTLTQKMIFHAFLSRSNNGFVRERHIRAILIENYPEWIFPYIVKLADEYVIEILEVIYLYLKSQDCSNIQNFCKLNLPSFMRSYSRMVSYWNEYYRRPFSEYVGRKLFTECFGYQNAYKRKT